MKLIQGDCITEMQKLIDEGVKVDLVLTDPPYGTIKGMNLKGWETQNTSWDTLLDTKLMFENCEKLLRMNGNLILFSQEPYTSYLRQYNYPNLPFIYPYYWLKNHFANNLTCNKAPVSYVEDLSVYRKKYDTDNTHPLREYSKRLLDYIGCSKKQVMDSIGGGVDHFLRYGSSQFALCTGEIYNDLIRVYHIDNWDCFKSYKELKRINENYSPKFHLGSTNFKSNVLKYSKPYNRFHPTEKPVDLLEDLIRTYTDEGDTVLDFTMGSGSTGVACRNTGRDFIGIELDEKYFEIAKERIYDGQVKLV